ncbi:hypothetical protein ABPG74_020109 [Tetrahymena malaccensis]
MQTNFYRQKKCSKQQLHFTMFTGLKFVGKTQIVSQYFKEYDEETMIGLRIFQKMIIKNDIEFVLCQFDIMRQRSRGERSNQYFENISDAIMLVYDITNRITFEKVQEYYFATKKHNTKNFIYLLIGNFLDQSNYRQVSYLESQEFADSNGLEFIEVSARTGLNISDAYNLIINSIIQVK